MPSEIPSIRRDQLRKFLPDERAVREFEKVLNQMYTIVENTSNISTLSVTVADNTADILTNSVDIATNTSDIATNSSNIALKADKTEVIGVGQTWQNVAASRSLGTTYTNSTGKPIQVNVHVIGTANVVSTATVGGVVVSRQYITTTITATHSFIVPDGVSYSILSTTSTKVGWAELR